MLEMKLSRMMIALIDFQSFMGSPSSRQMLSMAIFTILGGLLRDLTSTSCCFLMDLTARNASINNHRHNYRATPFNKITIPGIVHSWLHFRQICQHNLLLFCNTLRLHLQLLLNFLRSNLLALSLLLVFHLEKKKNKSKTVKDD